MATVWDAIWSVYSGLRSMPRRVYLVTMWILCDELRALYAPWIGADELPLMAATMDLVRDVAISGETGETGQRGLELARAWDVIWDAGEAEAPPGLANTWSVFMGLAQEIGGLAGTHAGAQWLTNAAEERWRDWDRPGPILVNQEHAEELIGFSPMGQTFSRLDRVVTRVSGLASPEWDPVRIRAQIFPEDPPGTDQETA
jgi:hypothetical protein